MEIRKLRFLFLFFAAGLSTTYAAAIGGGVGHNGGYLTPNGKDFNVLLFNKVLDDTQSQARFASKILGTGYSEPSSYEGTVELGNAGIKYHAEHGKINWQILNSNRLRGVFDALNYVNNIESSINTGNSIHPENSLLGVGIVIVVIGVTCAYLEAVATNNCERACGENGVQSMNYTCGMSNSSASCVCKPNPNLPTPVPPSPPYGAGPYDTGPYYDGYSYYSDEICDYNTPGKCQNAAVNRDSLRGGVLGQGWMRP